MKRRDLWIIGAILLVAGVLMAIEFGQRGQAEVARVYLDGALYASLPLTEDTELVVEQPNGAVNIIEVAGGGVRMRASTCPTQTCVDCGWRYPADVLLPDAAWIVCLPNRVSIELATE